MDKQSMRNKRGNLNIEIEAISRAYQVKNECQNTGIKALCKAFEKIGNFNKPVPKIGRPKETKEKKILRKISKKAAIGFLEIPFDK